MRPDRDAEGVRKAPSRHRPEDDAAPRELGLERRERDRDLHEEEVRDGGPRVQAADDQLAEEELPLLDDEGACPHAVLVVAEGGDRRRLRDEASC